MATRPFTQTFRGERSALDLPVAALAGIAVAFAAFAVPSDVLAELIGATRLPEILPAAQPPLGTTARIALASGGALTVFAFAFLLLRWLDRFASAPAKAATVAPPRPVSADAPKLRKRDVHPDAPAVRPISAVLELGEPASPLAVKRKSIVEAEPVRARAIVTEPEPEPVRAPAPAPEPEPEPVRAPAPAPEPEPVAARPEPVEPVRPPSLSELMARLERGLTERRPTSEDPVETAAPAPRPAPQVFPEAGDDRLQSAIESLQRLAARDR